MGAGWLKTIRLALHNLFGWHDHKLYEADDFVISFDFKYRCDCGHVLWITKTTYDRGELALLRDMCYWFNRTTSIHSGVS